MPGSRGPRVPGTRVRSPELQVPGCQVLGPVSQVLILDLEYLFSVHVPFIRILSIRVLFFIRILFQFGIFKTLSYCFEEAIGFNVKASFASSPVSRLIRDITNLMT